MRRPLVLAALVLLGCSSEVTGSACSSLAGTWQVSEPEVSTQGDCLAMPPSPWPTAAAGTLEILSKTGKGFEQRAPATWRHGSAYLDVEISDRCSGFHGAITEALATGSLLTILSFTLDGETLRGETTQTFTATGSASPPCVRTSRTTATR